MDETRGEGATMSDDRRDGDRRLESPDSQAARTDVAHHDDALSPAKALADSVNFDGGQRVGSSPPVANPIVSFPERHDAPAG
jgi:hypothetical protein